MQELVTIREATVSEKGAPERFDLLSGLLGGGESNRLSREELIGEPLARCPKLALRADYSLAGNLFIFLVAGHEVLREEHQQRSQG
jgi:hypothetical protein